MGPWNFYLDRFWYYQASVLWIICVIKTKPSTKEIRKKTKFGLSIFGIQKWWSAISPMLSAPDPGAVLHVSLNHETTPTVSCPKKEAPDSEAVFSSPSDLASPSMLLSTPSSSPLFHHRKLGNLRNHHRSHLLQSRVYKLWYILRMFCIKQPFVLH